MACLRHRSPAIVAGDCDKTMPLRAAKPPPAGGKAEPRSATPPADKEKIGAAIGGRFFDRDRRFEIGTPYHLSAEAAKGAALMTPQQEGGRGGGGRAGRTDRCCSVTKLERRPSAGIGAFIHKFTRARRESTPLRTRVRCECSCSHVTEGAEPAKSRGEHTWRRGRAWCDQHADIGRSVFRRCLGGCRRGADQPGLQRRSLQGPLRISRLLLSRHCQALRGSDSARSNCRYNSRVILPILSKQRSPAAWSLKNKQTLWEPEKKPGQRGVRDGARGKCTV